MNGMEVCYFKTAHALLLRILWLWKCSLILEILRKHCCAGWTAPGVDWLVFIHNMLLREYIAHLPQHIYKHFYSRKERSVILKLQMLFLWGICDVRNIIEADIYSGKLQSWNSCIQLVFLMEDFTHPFVKGWYLCCCFVVFNPLPSYLSHSLSTY